MWSRKTFILSFLALFVLILALGGARQARTVHAQCSSPSSCLTCHVTQGQHPPDDSSLWHRDHANQDFCFACHGGKRDAQDAQTAHTGMTMALEQMADECKVCHASDYQEQFDIYAAELGIVDTHLYTGAEAEQGLPFANVVLSTPVPAATLAPAEEVCPPEDKRANQVLALLLAAGVFGGGSFMYWNERRLRRPGSLPASWLRWLLAVVRSPSWSPYAAGVLLGFTAILAVSLSGHILTASGPVATLGSSLVHALAPAFASASMYFSYVFPPGLNWNVTLYIGIFLGGMLSALTSRTWRLRWNDDRLWPRVFGPQPWKRFVVGFLGAVVLQYGASLAGGCTSGLAISGGILLAPAAFIFMAGMFISGIIVALLVFRGRY